MTSSTGRFRAMKCTKVCVFGTRIVRPFERHYRGRTPAVHIRQQLLLISQEKA